MSVMADNCVEDEVEAPGVRSASFSVGGDDCSIGAQTSASFFCQVKW